MANSFKRKLSRSIGTTLTTVGGYTVPASTQVTAIGLTVANVSAAAIKVDVALNDGTNNTYLVKNADVASGGTLVVVGGDQKVVLEPNDSIKVRSNVAASVDVVLSILEVA